MIKNKIKKVVGWFTSLFRDDNEFRVVTSEDLPNAYVNNVLYLVGEHNVFWQAAMLCPCKCGDLIQLTLDNKGKPRWQVSLNKKMQPTLKPSVHRKVNCKSHFVLKNGKVIWCTWE